MKKKVVGMVLNSFYPHDIRVKKEAETLMREGYKVCLLCYKRWEENRFEIIDGIHIQRVYIGENKVLEGFWDTINAITFYHPLVGIAMKKFIDDFDINILHIHDLPLAGTAIRIGKKKNMKIILDLHENYPEALRVWFSWRKSSLIQLKNRLFFNYNRWLKFENYAVFKSDYIIAVVDEMKDRLIKDHHLSSKKITVVTNTEKTSYVHQKIDKNIYENIVDKFIILYAGNIGPHRGIDTVINSMKYLSKYKNIYFVIVGSASSDVMMNLENIAIENGVSNNVIFKGYQPFHTFYSYMSQASVNVIPHKKNGHTDHTIPHKIFQAMMVGKPVLVSTCKPLKRVVERYNSGEIFEAGNPIDCASKIMSIYRNSVHAKKMGKNGIRATLNGDANWENTGNKLVSLYKKAEK
ncbi:MAG: glycosyltransferase family 4 protein [Balneolales bacterium]